MCTTCRRPARGRRCDLCMGLVGELRGRGTRRRRRRPRTTPPVAEQPAARETPAEVGRRWRRRSAATMPPSALQAEAAARTAALLDNTHLPLPPARHGVRGRPRRRA